jgi:hypothetical protein
MLIGRASLVTELGRYLQRFEDGFNRSSIALSISPIDDDGSLY